MLWAMESEAHPFDWMVVFGDSLSDTGNTVGARYSNGPLWIEHLADRLAVSAEPVSRGGGNYAVGGARVDGGSGSFSLRDQAHRFLASRPPTAALRQTLFIVYGGGNDLFAALADPDPQRVTSGAATALLAIIRDLADAGASHMLVPNLPDLARVPAVRQHGAETQRRASDLTRTFNRILEEGLLELERGRVVRLRRLDAHRLLEQAVRDPVAAGLAGVDFTTPCVPDAASAPCVDPDRRLFWDSVHPTAVGHARLGAAAFQRLLSAD